MLSAWTIEKPPTISLDSMNGPSVTTFAWTTRPFSRERVTGVEQPAFLEPLA